MYISLRTLQMKPVKYLLSTAEEMRAARKSLEDATKDGLAESERASREANILAQTTYLD